MAFRPMMPGLFSKPAGGAPSATTYTLILPGFGIYVDSQDGKTRQVPGYGIVSNRS